VARSPGGPLGLPTSIRACLFDVDGVLTQTAKPHADAWKQMFDGYLRARSARTGAPFVPFDVTHDYFEYVDGKPRAEGVRSFLVSRGIALPEGEVADPPEKETLNGLGNRKNELVLAIMRRDGVEAFPDAALYLDAAASAGLRRAVVSASTNCEQVLEAAGLSGLVEVHIDGAVATRQRLRGKPAPDTFLAAARAVGVDPREAAVFEDALAGVAAGRAGGFGYVVGVDRVGHAAALRARGADVVVSNLVELLGRP
jgi:beta-phosphoglucomutase family hydrolase